MDLMAQVIQKNSQVMLQNLMLQKSIHERVAAPEFNSFILSFVVAPFVVGISARLLFGPKALAPHRLYGVVLSVLKFRSFF